MGLFKKNEPVDLTVCGKAFKCTVCENDRFWQRSAQLNTSVATFLNWDWVNKSANCFVCTNCRYVHWFLPE